MNGSLIRHTLYSLLCNVISGALNCCFTSFVDYSRGTPIANFDGQGLPFESGFRGNAKSSKCLHARYERIHFALLAERLSLKFENDNPAGSRFTS